MLIYPGKVITRRDEMVRALELRVGRIFNSANKLCVNVPIDHGFYMGNVEGLEDPFSLLQLLMDAHIDSTLMSFGMAKITNELFCNPNPPGKILTIDYPLMTVVPGEVQGILDYELSSTVELALKWDFCAVKVLLPWGLEKGLQMKVIKTICHLASECDRASMPLMIEPVLLGESIPTDKRNDPGIIANSCRISLEIGADILKVPYTGDVNSFSQITRTAKVPVLILGGPKMTSLADIFKTARESVEAGGKGVVFGRNVWQSKSIKKIIRGLKYAVYEQKNELDILRELNL